MCETCGCGDPEIVPIEVQERILSDNDAQAGHNRSHFEGLGVLAINLMGSPGAGKTAVLEATAKAADGRLKLGAVSGDLATERDADRLNASGIVSATITTGSACHLDARLVHHALHHFPSNDRDIFFIRHASRRLAQPGPSQFNDGAETTLPKFAGRVFRAVFHRVDQTRHRSPVQVEVVNILFLRLVAEHMKAQLRSGACHS